MTFASCKKTLCSYSQDTKVVNKKFIICNGGWIILYSESSIWFTKKHLIWDIWQFHRSKYFEAMKAGKLAIRPWLSYQYTKNTLMDELCVTLFPRDFSSNFVALNNWSRLPRYMYKRNSSFITIKEVCAEVTLIFTSHH